MLSDSKSISGRAWTYDSDSIMEPGYSRRTPLVNQDALRALKVPTHIIGNKKFSSESAHTRWENALISFLSANYRLFTVYPNYFKVRGYEFRLIQQLLPSYFSIHREYKTILEVGCGFGYKSLLLSPFGSRIIGTDMPERYGGYVVGAFSTSVDVSRTLVNDLFKNRKAHFLSCWPDRLEIKSGTVQLVFSEYLLEHVPDPSTVIDEMHRVLKDGGIMIHVVPNTMSRILPFVEVNATLSARKFIQVARSYLRTLLHRSNGYRISLNGTVVPSPHSEHIHHFSEELELNKVESYLFAMLDAGFKIERVLSTREFNNVIVARK